jgi:hypothetical protein
MKCEEVQQELIDYIDNLVGVEVRKDIEEHLEKCEKCRSEYEELQTVMNSFETHEFKMPDECLRENFNTMLQSEIDKLKAINNKPENSVKKNFIITWTSPLLKIAAGFILLIAGILIGMNLKPGNDNAQTAQYNDLKKEVREMKELVMFTMLKEESPSERIQAVNYADEIIDPNQKVIFALINTLNHDKNVNVRLAAAYSLVRFSDNKLVANAFVDALEKEKEPILQIVLINILTDKKETKAVKPIRKIISDPGTIKDVRDIAEKSVKVLL